MRWLRQGGGVSASRPSYAIEFTSNPLRQGLSGFGSAIIHTLIWVICTSAGANGGPLQLSVSVDCVTSFIMSFFLLFSTDACRNGDPGLVIALFSMTVGGSMALLLH